MNSAGQTYALAYDPVNDVTQFFVNQGVVTYVLRVSWQDACCLFVVLIMRSVVFS
jgi:hypothetical protein